MATTTKDASGKRAGATNGKLLRSQTETSTKKRIDLHTALLENFGFDKFKGNQEKAIESVLAGKDTFVIMPTGG